MIRPWGVVSKHPAIRVYGWNRMGISYQLPCSKVPPCIVLDVRPRADQEPEQDGETEIEILL